MVNLLNNHITSIGTSKITSLDERNCLVSLQPLLPFCSKTSCNNFLYKRLLLAKHLLYQTGASCGPLQVFCPSLINRSETERKAALLGKPGNTLIFVKKMSGAFYLHEVCDASVNSLTNFFATSVWMSPSLIAFTAKLSFSLSSLSCRRKEIGFQQRILNWNVLHE